MKVSPLLLLAFVYLTSVTPVMAQSHLVPEQGILNEQDGEIASYLFSVRQVLLDNLSAPSDSVFNPVIRVVVMPSFQPEWVISIEDTPNGDIVHFAEAKQHIWMSKEPLQIMVTHETATVDAKTARLLHQVWFQALLEVRVPQTPRMALDGTDYRFSCFERGYGILSGQTHSPGKGTSPRDLVIIAGLLKDYVQAQPSNRPGILASIQETATSLEAKLSYASASPAGTEDSTPTKN